MKKIILLLLIITSLKAAAQKANTLTPADKLYGLSKFWQEVNYNFVYIDKLNRSSWDSIYKDLLIKVQQTSSDYAYYRELQKFCAMLKDRHTNVFLPQSIKTRVTMFGEYRLFIKHIDNKAIIVRTNGAKNSSRLHIPAYKAGANIFQQKTLPIMNGQQNRYSIWRINYFITLNTRLTRSRSVPNAWWFQQYC